MDSPGVADNLAMALTVHEARLDSLRGALNGANESIQRMQKHLARAQQVCQVNKDAIRELESAAVVTLAEYRSLHQGLLRAQSSAEQIQARLTVMAKTVKGYLESISQEQSSMQKVRQLIESKNTTAKVMDFRR